MSTPTQTTKPAAPKRAPAPAIVLVAGVAIIGLYALLRPQPAPVAEPQTPPAAYQVVRVDDISSGVAARARVHAALAGGITQAQVVPTLDAIVAQTRRETPGLDAIVVFLHSEPAVVGQGWDVGTATWAPGGNIANAAGGDGTDHRTVHEVRQDVEAYLEARSADTERFGLSEEQRRAYIREVVAAEDRATAEADAQVDPAADVMENIRLQRELREAYVAEVMARYGLTPEQHTEISTEAFQEGWPLQ